MKLTLTIPILAGLLGMTGCTTLLSTNSFTLEEEVIVDPHLPGTWVNERKRHGPDPAERNGLRRDVPRRRQGLGEVHRAAASGSGTPCCSDLQQDADNALSWRCISRSGCGRKPADCGGLSWIATG